MPFIYTLFIFCFFYATDTIARSSYGFSDSRAYSAPARFDTDLNALIDYLTQPFSKDEKQKARVIFAWIATHIQYDDYEYRTSYEYSNKQPFKQCTPIFGNEIDCYKDTPSDTFEKRSGVCRHFAKLFAYMARRAGLDALVISGKAEGGNHAWNAVKIKNKWYLLDVTWAQRGRKAFVNIQNETRYLQEIEKRKTPFNKNAKKNPKRFNDNWFLVDPKEMIKTHIPNNKKWSLLPSYPK